MIFGHACKVKSKGATCIDAQTYEHFKDVVDCEEFLNGIQRASAQLHAQEDGVERTMYQEEFTLPLSRNIFGLLTIPVYVNHMKYRFIIDTGAQISGVKEQVVKTLGLRKTKGKVTIGSIGGTQKEMPGVVMESFQFGALEYRNRTMIELADSDFSMRFGNIDLLSFDGILGWDILSQMDFELDDIKKEFKVLKNRLKVPNPNMLKGSFPCFIVKLPNGNSALYGFDSGSKMSWIGEDAIQLHNYRSSKEVNSVGFGVHGMEKLQLKVIEHCTLLLDKAKIDLYQTMSGRTKLFPSFNFDGVLGNEICKGRRMRIINSAQMVLIA